MTTEPESPANIERWVQRLAQDLSDLQEALAQLKAPQEVAHVRWPRATLDGLRESYDRFRAEWEKGLQREEILSRKKAEAADFVLDLRKRRLEALLDRRRTEAEKAEEGKFVVAGRIMDKATGAGLPNVEVSAFDLDRKYDDRLGGTRTDELGYYRIEYAEANFKDLFEGRPETYIEVLDETGNSLYTSTKSFVHKTAEVVVIDAQVEGSRLPTSLALGKAVAGSIAKRVEAYELRRQLLRSRWPPEAKGSEPTRPKAAEPKPETAPPGDRPQRLEGRSPVPETPAMRKEEPELPAMIRELSALIDVLYPKVNVNEASPEELMTLPGIGTELAQAIVEGGPYGAIDELIRIRGVSREVLRDLRKRLTV